MTDPQFPPPSPSGAVPPVPPAPTTGAFPPPAYQAPEGAFAAPVGGYPAGTAPVPGAVGRRSATMGIAALISALVAAIVTPIVAGIFSWEIGRRIPEAAVAAGGREFDSLAFLSPARDQVLGAELSFWAGTILGLAAIVLGIIAIARRQGRGYGIAALIIGIVAPVVFFVVAFFALSFGAAAGAVSLSA